MTLIGSLKRKGILKSKSIKKMPRSTTYNRKSRHMQVRTWTSLITKDTDPIAQITPESLKKLGNLPQETILTWFYRKSRATLTILKWN
jgi:hypothetical protein